MKRYDGSRFEGLLETGLHACLVWPTILVLLGCVLVQVVDAAEAVKVAHVPLMNFAPLYVALDKGYFRDQGIQVDLERVKSGTEAMGFLASGQIEVGAVGMSAGAFTAFDRNMDLKIVATAAAQPKKDGPVEILVRKALWEKGEVKQVADLKGRKVGIAGGIGSAGAFFVVKALRGVNLGAKDIEIVNLANADIPLALEKGAVDAGLVGAPYSTMAVDGGIAAVLARDMDPGGATTYFMYSGKFIRERRSVAGAFAVGLMKGARDLQGAAFLDPTNVTILAKYTGVKEAEIRATRPLVFYPDLAINTESLREQEAIHRESGWVKYTTPVPIARMIDPTFQQHALQVLGPLKH